MVEAEPVGQTWCQAMEIAVRVHDQPWRHVGKSKPLDRAIIILREDGPVWERLIRKSDALGMARLG